VAAAIDLAKLQEARGAVSEAESTLLSLRQAQPGNMTGLYALAAFYARAGEFPKAIRTLEEAAAADPSDANGYQILATYYWERISKDPTLTPEERTTSIRAGISATDKALAAQPDFVPALVYKNLFLRMQANAEPDVAKQRALMAEADRLRARAMELRSTMPSNQTSAGRVGAPPPPPPPPPPADLTSSPDLVNGKAPIRVGGNVLTPVKVKDVRPEYPPDALQARIGGVVIVEAVIDENGDVARARVLRSIPALDKAALDAVYQWKFMPTLLNGAAVPVVMTVTVNFTLQ
jgi:TonB family protein